MISKFGTLSLIAALALSGCAAADHNKTASCCDDSSAKQESPMAGPKTAPAQKTEGRMVVVNTICPIGGDDFEAKDRPSELVRTVNGENIGFCCDHCTAKFDKMSEQKKAEVLAAARANKTL